VSSANINFIHDGHLVKLICHIYPLVWSLQLLLAAVLGLFYHISERIIFVGIVKLVVGSAH